MIPTFLVKFICDLTLRLGFAGAFCYEALRVPPLLPEYLSQPIQVVVESSLTVNTDWWAIGGSVLGAALGALLGGLVAYRVAILANRRLINQSKLEECLTLIDEMQSVYLPILRRVGRMPKAHGLTEAKSIVSTINPEEMVNLAIRIHTLTKLHARPLLEKANRLITVSRHTRSLFENINERLGAGSQDNIDNWRDYSIELAQSVHELCNDMDSYIEKNAKT